jgi:hypothetical protein
VARSTWQGRVSGGLEDLKKILPRSPAHSLLSEITA